MKAVLIKNANIVNEGKIVKGDVLVQDGRIAEISETISAKSSDTNLLSNSCGGPGRTNFNV